MNIQPLGISIDAVKRMERPTTELRAYWRRNSNLQVDYFPPKSYYRNSHTETCRVFSGLISIPVCFIIYYEENTLLKSKNQFTMLCRAAQDTNEFIYLHTQNF